MYMTLGISYGALMGASAGYLTNTVGDAIGTGIAATTISTFAGAVWGETGFKVAVIGYTVLFLSREIRSEEYRQRYHQLMRWTTLDLIPDFA